MQEFVGAVQLNDELGLDGFPEGRAHRLFCFPVNQGQGRDLGDIAQAGELFQGVLGRGGEPLQLAHHEIHHVVGIALGADAIHVPFPHVRGRVEREQPLLRQRGKKLDREERIAAGLLVHQLRQGLCSLRRAMQGIGHEPADIVQPEGRQHNLLHPRTGLADRLQRARQRVRGTDLIVPVGANQQQMPHLGMRGQMLDEVERRGIQPLQIIEK